MFSPLCAESPILSVHAEAHAASMILSAPHTESMILSVSVHAKAHADSIELSACTESTILSACTESIILSVWQ
jgi:hypothetical protein